MVFYYTSVNCRMIRNILMDYDSLNEISPNEYINNYVESCPTDVDDTKIAWISKTFLSLQKHLDFFRKIAFHLSDELSPEEQDYFIIIFQAIIFQIEPVDMKNIYKTLYNLSPDLLSIFTEFLSNSEVLTYIADIAQIYFDSGYITDCIIAPLFKWQPYISEMAHDYALYLKKVADRKIKPLTVPVEPTVLNRKHYNKEVHKTPSEPSFQINSVSTKPRRMVTKSAIDRKLKAIHEKNKQSAANLLKTSKAQAQSFPRLHMKKKTPFFEEPSDTRPLPKPKKIVTKTSLPPIRENAALIKRLNKRAKLMEENEIKWIEGMVLTSGNCVRVEEMLEEERREAHKQRLYEVERAHLLGQITHEQAALAKKKISDGNKKKAEELKKKKEMWDQTIEKCRSFYLKNCRQSVANCTLLELRIIEAKQNVADKKKALADQIKKDAKALREEILQNKKRELEEKIKMIKEIKTLAMIAKRTKMPRIIDLTECAGIGYMCEMSLAELQERLIAFKIEVKEEIERRKADLKEKKEIAKKELEEQRNTVREYFDERERYRKSEKVMKNAPIFITGKKKAEIDDLRELLEKRRAERLKLVDGADYAEFASFIK